MPEGTLPVIDGLLNPQPAHYEATLTLTGVLAEDEQQDRFALTLDDSQRLLVRAFPHLRRILREKHLGQRLKLGVWPHANQDGSLKEVSQLFKWKPADEQQNAFRVVGRLIGKHPEEQRAAVLINPNADGRLAQSFVINVRLEPQALETTPELLRRGKKRRQGVEFTGKLKNGVLWADTAKTVRLGPTKLEAASAGNSVSDSPAS